MNTLTPRLALLLTLPPLLWAGNAVAGRLMVGTVPPLALNAMRWLLAGLLLAPLARGLFARPQELLRHWRYLALAGLLGVGSYNALQYQALHSSTPLNVTLIAASMPVWMLAVGALAFRVRPTRRELLGAVLSLAGVAVVISRGDAAALARVHFVSGDLLMLAAVFCWSIYSWMLARPPASMKKTGWNRDELLMAQILFGAPLATGMAGLEFLLDGSQPIAWGPGLALALAYVAIGPSLIAYRCWGIGVAEAGPALAAFFSNLAPVFAALLSAALLGEGPQLYHGLAFALIVAGILVPARKT
ncbi:DMT family transporter [Paucibacter sp. R3-3]|uniref:DMT family transporter n=1 Tax=Roseateles agri TaxID=3098619 RepID=A0ABU5DKK5_9BURK|nr:DMT family transporter [Paucibacter sp. R3-3]MDY0746664.1 DMT family transporter [Paucibacter sp. R3-3]